MSRLSRDGVCCPAAIGLLGRKGGGGADTNSAMWDNWGRALETEWRLWWVNCGLLDQGTACHGMSQSPCLYSQWSGGKLGHCHQASFSEHIGLLAASAASFQVVPEPKCLVPPGRELLCSHLTGLPPFSMLSLPLQEDLEKERSQLLTRAIVAEEQVLELQDYIEKHLAR